MFDFRGLYFAGGHQEYFAASMLFVASTGLFLVCFDSSNLVWTDYYSRVGTYIDLVDQTAAVANIKPKILLVATKVESPDQFEETLEKILLLAKDQLASLSSNSFLVDGILKTSSKIANKEVSKDMYGKIYTLCTADKLRSKPKETIPTSWFDLLDLLKLTSQTTVDQVVKILKEIESRQNCPENISKEVLDSLVM